MNIPTAMPVRHNIEQAIGYLWAKAMLKGELHKLIEQWAEPKSACPAAGLVPSAKPLTPSDLMGTFIITGVAAAVALLLHAVKLMTHELHRCQAARLKNKLGSNILLSQSLTTEQLAELPEDVLTAHLRDAFNVFDANKSGNINQSELLEVMMCLGREMTDKEITTLLRACDTNNNGVLEFGEFERFARKVLLHSGPMDLEEMEEALAEPEKEKKYVEERRLQVLEICQAMLEVLDGYGELADGGEAK
eukprot:gnl/TRDRNA2_/TRDRNA2_131752_c2_seq1.p1 gnl/TRDRNA2_/TRDRNA2_131752_c2~~gnl/TRDRNA2_/TRDRNA2_131752_c2_seq1.p1  ORF type:complete len:248 (+),score=65.83 gnl/TRDRNA2_/TRDRNA2_131752_c2_seq1:67-810(+)